MSDTYFVRIRGRVQGPFSTEKLQLLVRRGQVSRTHEVSEDGTIWRRASEFPELFQDPTPVSSSETRDTDTQTRDKGTDGDGGAAKDEAKHEADSGVSRRSPDDSAEWYYAVGTSHKGPISYAALRHLFWTGRLPPETDVWGAGMPDWVPAYTISGLVPAAGSKPRRETQPSSSEKESGRRFADDNVRRLVWLLKSMRLWTMVVAIVGLIMCVIGLIGGIVDIVGVNDLRGLFTLTYVLVEGAGIAFLLVFGIRVGTFLDERSQPSLIHALQAMRGFWIYVGILACIAFSMLLIVISFAVAGAGQFMPNGLNW
ncbi:MAG: DUF4339 domain-containing protein [Pirellulaceae bacterium]